MPRDNFQALFANANKTNNDENIPSAPAANVNEASVEATQVNSQCKQSINEVQPSLKHPQPPLPPPPQNTKPGTESIAYLKRFIGPAIQNIREFNLNDKMNALADNLEEYPDKINRALENRERKRRESEAMEEEGSETLEEECTRLKIQSVQDCRQISVGYDALADFVKSHPHGRYEEFIEHLSTLDGACFTEKNYYGDDSHYRKLWNDNLTLGLKDDCTTLEGRIFVPAVVTKDSQPKSDTETSSHDNKAQPYGRALTASAMNVLSNVSTLALKPLREFQLAEKVNAMQLDIEEEEARREMERYILRMEEKRDLEDMMRVKREAEERTLKLTQEHLVEFSERRPEGSYTEWIEDLHPENAHDGTLLEGFGKTIDHRFFVEESDHRRIWNEHLTKDNYSRMYVPPRPKQTDENGDLVVADDLLSGSGHDALDVSNTAADAAGSSRSGADLITFD